MFHEYRELIKKLKGNNKRFDNLFTRHNQLDNEIKKLDSSPPSAGSMEIVKLKLEKLEIKREIQKILENEAEK